MGLSDIVAGRLGRHESGFGASWHDHEVKPEELLEQVSADDLAEFGLLPEFIGRLPVVSVLDELTEADLARILTEPKNALVKQYRKMFAVDGVDLVVHGAGGERHRDDRHNARDGCARAAVDHREDP